jgi:hypothetical protein
VSLWCGGQCCQQIGRDRAGWFNPESQTRGLSSTGTTTILSQGSCTASFRWSLAAASAKGTLWDLAALYEKQAQWGKSSPVFADGPVVDAMRDLENRLLRHQTAQEIEMDNSCASSDCSASDLTRRKTAWLFWYVPILLVIVGPSWSRGRVWLWLPAFVVIGVGCLANAARWGRIHCYPTGPLFLLAAVFVALSAFGIVALCPGLFLLVVLGTCCLAQCAEIPLGRYRKS